jgi:hypothetical protein
MRSDEVLRSVCCGGGSGSVGVVGHVQVAKEGVEVVREEVVVVEELVARRRRRDASSRARALPKNLIAPHPYRFSRGRVPEAYCPISRCTPTNGMRKTMAAKRNGCVTCVA